MRKILLATTFLTCGLIPTVAHADPISIGFALISSMPTSAAAWSALTFSTFMSSFIPRLALGYALNALIPKPSIGGASGYTVNTLGSAQPTAVVYGKVKVGGVIFYQETTNDNKYLHTLIALAGHEVQQIEKVYLNDEELTLDASGNVTAPTNYVGKVRIKKHLGADDQAADATLSSESANWGLNHKASGIAYLYVRFEFDADAFPNGVPQVTALVEGKKVVQTGSGTGSYSANSARCLADYLVFSGIANYDEIDNSLFTTATSVCDQNVTLSSGGTQHRYECNGTFTTDIAPKEVVSGMLASMGGMLWYSQGKWKMKAASFTNPVLNLDENDLRSALSIKTRNSRRDGFNKVIGTFRGIESNWQTTDYPAITSTTFLGIDNNQENSVELNFPFVSNSPAAQRIGKIALYRNREQVSVSGVYGLRALQLTVGDIVRLKNERLGFKDPDNNSLGKLFEVVDWSFGLDNEASLQCNMVLQEISSGVFDWDADETLFESNNTTLLSPFFVPVLTVTSSLTETRIVNEHVVNVLPVIITTNTNQTSLVDKVEVEYKKSSDSIYKSLGTGQLGTFEALDLEAAPTGTNYDIRARAINSLGVKGSYTTITVIVKPPVTDPSDVTGFDFSISGGSLFFTWNPVPDKDLAYYQIKFNSLTSGATWANTTNTVIQQVPRPASSAIVPALFGTYLIRASNKTGQTSDGDNSVANGNAIIITESLLPALTPVPTTSNSNFYGVLSNTQVVSNNLRMSSFGSVTTGTYSLQDTTATGSAQSEQIIIDVAQARTTTVSSEVVFTRHQSNAGLFDNIPQTWDSWEGNFDTWTNSDNEFDDNLVVVKVSANSANPSNESDWGDYTDANGSQVVGRYFRFKAFLSNTNANVTPSISLLKATVGYS